MTLPANLRTNQTARLPSVLRRPAKATAPKTPVTIIMPLPPHALSPNARSGSWHAKANAVKKYRKLAGDLTFAELYARPRQPMANACSKATFYFRDRRRHDRDNLLASLKSAFDGLADGGLLVDDAGLTHLPVEVAVDRERPRVEIVIVEL